MRDIFVVLLCKSYQAGGLQRGNFRETFKIRDESLGTFISGLARRKSNDYVPYVMDFKSLFDPSPRRGKQGGCSGRVGGK